MRDDEIVEQIGRIDLFRGLSRGDLRNLVRSAQRESWPTGAEVIAEGGRAAAFHLVLNGTARVVRGGVEVDTLAAGDYIGEISLIDGGPRTATIVAADNLETLMIRRVTFQELLDAKPSFARELNVVLCRRIRELGTSPRHV